MAKLCPITNKRVVYLECQECDDKACRPGNNSKEDSFTKQVCDRCGNELSSDGVCMNCKEKDRIDKSSILIIKEPFTLKDKW